MHDTDAVGHIDRLFLVMRDIDKSDPQLLLQTFQFQLHLPAQLQIQCSQRFIQQQYFRLIDHRSGNGNALLLSAGELVRHTFFVLFQLYQAKRTLHPLCDLRLRDFADLQSIAYVIRHVHMRKQGIILKYRINIPLVGFPIRNIVALQDHLPAIRQFQTRNDPQRRGLAAAGGT